MADLAARLATQDVVLELTDAARALLVREGTDPAFGARPLKRTIQRFVENPLARAIVAGEFKPGDRITADADRVTGTLVFSTETATVVTEARARSATPGRGGSSRSAPVPGGDRVTAGPCQPTAGAGATTASCVNSRRAVADALRRRPAPPRAVCPDPLPAPADDPDAGRSSAAVADLRPPRTPPPADRAPGRRPRPALPG